MKYLFFYSFIYCFLSCGKPSEHEENQFSAEKEQITNHFSISKQDNYIILEIKNPFVGANFVERYLLYPKNQHPPKLEGITHFIPVPVDRVGITSASHLGLIEPLDQLEKIMAATNLDLYFSSPFQEKIQKGAVRSIGQQRVEHETLINENLDLLFSYAIDVADLNELKRLRELGQKVILIAEYMEQEPLQKAAWLKAMALFFENEASSRADSIFKLVESNYLVLKNRAKVLGNKPKVMIGYPWKGTWYVSGGESFQAKLMADAGANYIWKDTEQAGSIPFSVEQVIATAIDADYWINCGNVTNFSTIEKNQALLVNFNAFQNKKIFHHFNRSNKKGANDYWEQGIVRPDLILADLLSIFHEDSLSDHSLYFYSKLEP